jgi:hypothetical protein
MDALWTGRVVRASEFELDFFGGVRNTIGLPVNAGTQCASRVEELIKLVGDETE